MPGACAGVLQRDGAPRRARPRALRLRSPHLTNEGPTTMGKYFIAWLLGVPAVVLVAFYFFFGR